MTRTLLLGALALSLAACDAAGPDPALADAALDDAAVTLATAIAVDAGGILEDAAAAAALADTDAARLADPHRRGCRAERTFDEAAVAWSLVADCERGDPDARFYAAFERTATVQFFDAAGQPQAEARTADALRYDVLSASSLLRTPRHVHALTSLGVALDVTDLGADLVTVNGAVQRAATDTLRGARGERTVAYALGATLADVRGPRGTARRWRRAVEGTISGTFQATITRTPAGGETETVEIDEPFEITFPLDGSGDRVVALVLGGRRYRADVDTGEVTGMDA
ncbi:hypothetical protein [Rubrivirga sp. IMCC45206]|uniref:hypothetical protein n=1 Tax=Rubrivirga sp. IMCC45206 TaxID=3391614 RepID=UPI00398FCFAF